MSEHKPIHLLTPAERLASLLTLKTKEEKKQEEQQLQPTPVKVENENATKHSDQL
jgi:hypothetical protein